VIFIVVVYSAIDVGDLDRSLILLRLCTSEFSIQDSISGATWLAGTIPSSMSNLLQTNTLSVPVPVSEPVSNYMLTQLWFYRIVLLCLQKNREDDAVKVFQVYLYIDIL